MKSKKNTVKATLLCDLTEPLEGRHHHSLSIGAKRDVLLLSIPEPVKSSGSDLKTNEKTLHFSLHHWHNEATIEMTLPPTQQVFYKAQSLGKDEFLCVAGRCFPEEENAHIFNSEGTLQRSWHAGDGIEDVQITPGGDVWVSYFDEGVYGGTPLSRQGAACFDSLGTPLFGFATDTVGKAGEIIDCYALNVASNRDTWLIYYTGFPLVHLRDRQIIAIYQPVPEMIGSHAFAVCDSRRLFTGGYHFQNQIFWRDEALKRQIALDVTDENSDPLPWTRACGRGADLFLCNATKVWMLSLNEIGL